MKTFLTLILAGFAICASGQTNTTFYGNGAGNVGNNNSFFGKNAGKEVTGNMNVGIGAITLRSAGSQNVAVGHLALKISTANHSTVIGSKAMSNHTSGDRNTSIGYHSMINNLTGSNNTIVGAEAGYDNLGSGNVFIGHQAGKLETGSNKLYIANSSVGSSLIYGDFSSGQVGINTNSIDATLTVKGDIHAEAVTLDLTVPGPDYVFEEDYNLRSLEETEEYIKNHKHLPEVPSAKEMEEQGIDLAEMNMLLLKKVEELTLHSISQQKLINQLQERVEEFTLHVIDLQKQIKETQITDTEISKP